MLALRAPPVWLLILVGVLLVQRVAELLYARHNARRLLAAGAVAVRPDGMRAIVAVHMLSFVGVLAESALAPWTSPSVSLPGILLFATGQLLRYWSMVNLGWRWNTRVFVVPGLRPVRSGPYRVLRHPIYVGVTLELAGFALMGSAWATAALTTGLNLLALRRRIAIEDAALRTATAAPAPTMGASGRVDEG